MSQVFLSGMPEPPEGEHWCVACVMLLKAEVNRRYAEEFKAKSMADKPAVQWIAPKITWQPRVATVRGVCPIALELGILDLCWTHVQGIDPTQAGPSLLAANGGVPRGLIKGSG